jgi:uncharacterized protein with FMN-binding domain
VKRISFWFLSTVSAVVLLFGYDASNGTSGAQTSFVSGATAGLEPSSGATTSDPPSTAASSTKPPKSPPRSRSSAAGSSAGASPNAGTGSSATPSRTASPSATPTQTPTHTPTHATTSKVTGSVINTQWGPVQVQLTVSAAKITKVGILQYPNGNSRDIEIANYAFPVLIQETLSSQNANIDMVSGATYTSTGYIQSLQSALDQANL